MLKVAVVVLPCFEIPLGKEMSGVRHQTTVTRLCVQSFVSCERCQSMEASAILKMKGRLGAIDEYWIIMCVISGMERESIGR